MPAIRNTLLLLTFAAPQAVVEQCTKCTSFAEAAKAPAGVRIIQINPLIHGGTLTAIPTDLAQYTHLEELYLTDHGLTAVPKEIGSLTTLKSLSLAGNQLESVPDELFQLPHLKELILGNNAFSEAYTNELKKRVKKELPGVLLLID